MFQLSVNQLVFVFVLSQLTVIKILTHQHMHQDPAWNDTLINNQRSNFIAFY